MDKQLRNYAEVLIRNGVNLQENQRLYISGPVEVYEFIEIIAEVAYENKAKRVHVEYTHTELELLDLKNVHKEELVHIPEFRNKEKEFLAKEGAVFLRLVGTSPNAFEGINENLLSEVSKAKIKSQDLYRELSSEEGVRSSLAVVPTKAWAKMVYPSLDEELAVNKLWGTIIEIVKANSENPVDEWNLYRKNTMERKKKLTTLGIEKLLFKSKTVDLEVELAQNHFWAGGGPQDKNGLGYLPNVPTEEVFTAPYKYGINGWVKNSKPLSYNGNIIDEFYLKFEQGKVVEYSAKKGYETLKSILEADKGSSYIGEVALVSSDSNISKTNTIFYNTLLDENASCHLALGNAYKINVKGVASTSDEDYEKAGINKSTIHVDFMFGTEDMNIVGIKESGEEVQIFTNGVWCEI